MATLQEIVDSFTGEQGIPVPASVMGSADAQVLQIRRILERGLDDLSQRGAWERMVFEASWSSLAAESQGAITSLATNGFRYLIPETLWDRTEKLPLLGPIDSQGWQALKAIVITGPRYSFRLRGGLFLVTPAPPAGHTWVFEYVSKNFLLAVDGVTYRYRFVANTDDILIPDQIVQADLLWRWKKVKGLAYAEDFNTAERMIANALGRDGGKKCLVMDDNYGEGPRPGIFVPAGSWITP